MGLAGSIAGQRLGMALFGGKNIREGEHDETNKVLGIPEMKPKGIWNGGKLRGRDILGLALGAIGDGLANQYDMPPVAAPMLAKRLMDLQSAKDEAKSAELKRQREREDKQWEWANKPEGQPTPTEFERMLEASGVVRGSPEWTAAASKRVENLLNPMMAVQTTDAQGNPAITWVPRNGISAPAPRPKGKLTPIDGGPSGSPSGAPFRR